MTEILIDGKLLAALKDAYLGIDKPTEAEMQKTIDPLLAGLSGDARWAYGEELWKGFDARIGQPASERYKPYPFTRLASYLAPRSHGS